MRLLLVEDEPEMARALSSALARHDINVDHAPTLEFAREAIETVPYDVVLIDRQLPDGDGVELVPQLRARARQVPSIIISALGSTSDRIRGLDVGADDYLPKPFSVDELLARVRAVLRRGSEIIERIVEIGDLRFNTETSEVAVVGRTLLLTRRELLILERLVKRPGQIVPRDAMEEAVYGFDDDIQSNSLEANVSRLRKKLVDADARVEIHNIRGVGYLARAAT